MASGFEFLSINLRLRGLGACSFCCRTMLTNSSRGLVRRTLLTSDTYSEKYGDKFNLMKKIDLLAILQKSLD